MTNSKKENLIQQKTTNSITRIKIREFVFPDDYPAVYTLWKNAGSGIQLSRSDEPEEIKKKLERDPDLFLVAEVNQQIVGTVLGGYDGRRGLMYHLAVAKNWRRQGIGGKLVQKLEENLRKKGCIRYYLMVTKDNHTAIEFYRKRGWEPLELYIFAKNIG